MSKNEKKKLSWRGIIIEPSWVSFFKKNFFWVGVPLDLKNKKPINVKRKKTQRSNKIKYIFALALILHICLRLPDLLSPLLRQISCLVGFVLPLLCT